VSEDHKIRSMLKRQSAKVWAALHGRRAELICFVLLCFALFCFVSSPARLFSRHYFRAIIFAPLFSLLISCTCSARFIQRLPAMHMHLRRLSCATPTAAHVTFALAGCRKTQN
jgi:hypothetical protein